MRETRTVKIWLDTYRRLKVLAAQSGETLVEMLERMAQEEEQRRGRVGLLRNDERDADKPD